MLLARALTGMSINLEADSDISTSPFALFFELKSEYTTCIRFHIASSGDTMINSGDTMVESGDTMELVQVSS